MVKSKTYKISELTPAKDFTEMLDAQDLRVQMEVLNHLQDNLRKFQKKYIESFLTDINTILATASEKHRTKLLEPHADYIGYDKELEKSLYDTSENARLNNIRNQYGNRTLIFDMKNCELIEFRRDFLDVAKITIKGNILYLKYSHKFSHMSQALGSTECVTKMHHEIKMQVDMSNNTFISYSDECESLSSSRNGFYRAEAAQAMNTYHGHWNGKLVKS